MTNQNSTSNVEIVFPHPIKIFDEQEHHNSQEIVKKLNEVIVMLNHLKSAL